MCIRKPLVGRELVPLNGLLVVLCDALPVVIGQAEIELGTGDPLVCRKTVPLNGLLVVLCDALSFVVHQAKTELCVRVPLVCQGAVELEYGCVVTTLPGGIAIL